LIGNEWQLPGQTIEISKEYGLKSAVPKMIAYPTKRARVRCRAIQQWLCPLFEEI